MSEIQSAREQIAEDIKSAIEELAGRVANPRFSALRAQNPGVSISQLPTTAQIVKLGAGVAVNIDLPDYAQCAKFSCTSNLFVSRSGYAVVPTTAGTVLNTGTFIPDPQQYYYVADVRQLSVISPNDSYLSIEYLIQL